MLNWLLVFLFCFGFLFHFFICFLVVCFSLFLFLFFSLIFFFFQIVNWLFVSFQFTEIYFLQIGNWLFVTLRHKIPSLCKTVRPCIELLLIDICLSQKYQISKMDTKSNIGLQMCQKKQMLQHYRVKY